MRLADAANAFNDMPCVDAYTGRAAFLCQIALYDDNKRDSETGERRVLSVSPDVVLPTRRAVAVAGTRYILGHGAPDGYRGSVIRVGYVGHEATDLCQVRTLAEVCLDQPGFNAWGGRAWVKNATDSMESSALTPQSHLYFSLVEKVFVEHIIAFGDSLNVVRTVHQGPSGVLVVTCDELAAPNIETATIDTGSYDPLTEAMTAGTASVRVIRVRWQSLFAYRNSAAPKFGPEDIQIVVAQAAHTARPGQKVVLSDGTWQIESAQSEGSVWLCRARRH